MKPHILINAERIVANRVVPVFYHADESVCLHAVEACYAGGLRVFEFTNRGPAALANFKLICKRVQTDFPDLLIGAGTLYDTTTAQQFINAGAHFVVSPALMPKMHVLQSENSTLWIPGCATISELAQARELGAGLMKIFPGELLGPAFIRTALSVLPGLRLMPTGGVTPAKENLKDWFHAGVACVGLGSQLISNDIITEGNWKKLSARVREVIEITNELTKS